MQEELNALLANGKWSLIPKQPKFNIIGNKWNPNGSIARYTSRLIGKGFYQRFGIEYTETYSQYLCGG